MEKPGKTDFMTSAEKYLGGLFLSSFVMIYYHVITKKRTVGSQ